jgi:hypothetical protein
MSVTLVRAQQREPGVAGGGRASLGGEAQAQARALREGQALLEADAARASLAVEGLRAKVSALKARHPSLAPCSFASASTPPAPSAVAAPPPPAAPSAPAVAAPSSPPQAPPAGKGALPVPDPRVSTPPASQTPPPTPPASPDAIEQSRAEIWGLKASRAGFASLIVADFPPLFAEFRGKRFALLWRSSRDGFGARAFQRRCDRHANTLALIQDTAGNIFGGFTPVQWESERVYKADPSLKSFLFTPKNPHHFPARLLALKAEEQNRAVYFVSSWAHTFRASLFPTTETQTPTTETQTPTVALGLAALTRTTPALTRGLFSRVRGLSL